GCSPSRRTASAARAPSSTGNASTWSRPSCAGATAGPDPAVEAGQSCGFFDFAGLGLFAPDPSGPADPVGPPGAVLGAARTCAQSAAMRSSSPPAAAVSSCRRSPVSLPVLHSRHSSTTRAAGGDAVADGRAVADGGAAVGDDVRTGGAADGPP